MNEVVVQFQMGIIRYAMLPSYLFQNASLIVNQRKALDETRAMFPQLRHKIEEAKSRLEAQLVCCILAQ